ncbi:MAG TPA: tyrosine--tRNA ligase [Acidimicrobiia bacterium]|nr:tyrosine--tRNA ligase [Acidimicrobiia bacterium]
MTPDEQFDVLSAGAVDLVSEVELKRKLASRRSLRAKLGLDPSRPDIHIGHAVVLRRLRDFQELGHTAVLIVGDFTAQVGDPSGRSSTRPALTKAEADENAATYFEQAQRVLLPENLEIRYNSEWLGTMGIDDVLRLTARSTLARVLERDDFAKRYASGEPISVMELLYPLLQAWDSVMVQADVELGGTDQLFNFLAARPIQQQEGQEPQVVLTMPLLVGLDGKQKMSKSLDNYVGITEPPGTQYGKLLSLPDETMPEYFELATGWPAVRVAEVQGDLQSGKLRPRDAKRLLARSVVDRYHGDGAGAAAEAEFDRVFVAHQAPSDVPEVQVPGPTIRVASLLHLAFPTAVPSNKEGRRKIVQGGVHLAGEVVTDPDLEVAPAAVDGQLLRLGRRNWARLRA